MSVNTYTSVNPKPVFQRDLSKRSKFFVIFSSLKNPCDRIHQHSGLATRPERKKAEQQSSKNEFDNIRMKYKKSYKKEWNI